LHDVGHVRMTPIKPAVFVWEMSAGLRATREVRDVETASRVHLMWAARGKAWRKAAEVLSEARRGQASPQEARKTFVAAAKEAGVLIERGPSEKTLEGRRTAQKKIRAFWTPERRKEASTKGKQRWKASKAKDKP
jgi:glycine/D-amino acid oxidase-like deaminating enzyme